MCLHLAEHSSDPSPLLVVDREIVEEVREVGCSRRSPSQQLLGDPIALGLVAVHEPR
jgi:hypothetical protein